MALPIVHLLAAREWAQDKPALRECPEFYLGAIAPDAIHVRYGNDKSRKNEFHLGNWISPHPEQVHAYWAERFTPFDIGYGIHVLTDGKWVPRYKAAFPGLLKPTGGIYVEQYYTDTWQADFALMAHHPEIQAIFDLIRRAEPPEGNPFLTKAEFEKWKGIVLEGYQKPCPASGEVRFITEAYVEEFIHEVQDYLNETTRRYFPMSNSVLQAIADRRSVRAYAPEQITDEQLQALLDAGVQSPTANNSQHWHFSAVQDIPLLHAFNEDLRSLMIENAPNEDVRARFQAVDYSVFYKAPTVIFISMPKPFPGFFAPVDAGIAVENIALAAQGMGLGSVILGFPKQVFDSEKGEEYRKAFKFPEGHDFVIAIAVGKPAMTKEAHPVKENKVTIVK